MIPILLYICIALSVCALTWFLFEKARRKTHPVKGGLHRSVTLDHTHDIELYSNSFSLCSRKVRLVIAELGIEVKHHPIDLIETGWYQTISAKYLQVNPSGVVPTLVHKGHPVYESDDILNYAQALASADAPQLVPTDPRLQAEMHEWLSFCAIVSADLMGGMQKRAGACVPGLMPPLFATSIHYIPLRKILVGFLFHPTFKSPALFSALKVLGLKRMLKLKQVRELVHASRDHMLSHLQTIEQTLVEHGKPWILGEDYSLADISIGCLLHRLDETAWLDWFNQISNIPHVMAYCHRVQQRPAWAEAISAQSHPIIEKAKTDLLNKVSSDREFANLLYGRTASVSGTKQATLSW